MTEFYPGQKVTFKVGDLVERTGHTHVTDDGAVCEHRGIYKVTEVPDWNALTLDGFGEYTFRADNFKVVGKRPIESVEDMEALYG